MAARRYAVPRCAREGDCDAAAGSVRMRREKERKKERDRPREGKGRAMAMAADGCKACLLCTGKVETLENGCQEPSLF